MSFWDNMKKFTSSYSEDEYDEENFDEELYEEEEKPAPRAARRSSESAKEIDSAPAKAEAGGFNGKVLSMNSNKPSVVLFRPISFNDASQAADDLRSKKAVIVNMENVDKSVARRVVDFLSGCAYALDGKVKKIAQSTYLFCPNSMDVSGDLEAVQAEAEATTEINA